MKKIAVINDLSGLGKCSLTGSDPGDLGDGSPGVSTSHRCFKQPDRL